MLCVQKLRYCYEFFKVFYLDYFLLLASAFASGEKPKTTDGRKNLFLQISYNEKQMLFYANDVAHVPQYHTKAFFPCFENAKSKLNMLNLYA